MSLKNTQPKIKTTTLTDKELGRDILRHFIDYYININHAYNSSKPALDTLSAILREFIDVFTGDSATDIATLQNNILGTIWHFPGFNISDDLCVRIIQDALNMVFLTFSSYKDNKYFAALKDATYTIPGTQYALSVATIDFHMTRPTIVFEDMPESRITIAHTAFSRTVINGSFENMHFIMNDHLDTFLPILINYHEGDVLKSILNISSCPIKTYTEFLEAITRSSEQYKNQQLFIYYSVPSGAQAYVVSPYMIFYHMMFWFTRSAPNALVDMTGILCHELMHNYIGLPEVPMGGVITLAARSLNEQGIALPANMPNSFFNPSQDNTLSAHKFIQSLGAHMGDRLVGHGFLNPNDKDVERIFDFLPTGDRDKDVQKIISGFGELTQYIVTKKAINGSRFVDICCIIYASFTHCLTLIDESYLHNHYVWEDIYRGVCNYTRVAYFISCFIYYFTYETVKDYNQQLSQQQQEDLLNEFIRFTFNKNVNNSDAVSFVKLLFNTLQTYEPDTDVLKSALKNILTTCYDSYPEKKDISSLYQEISNFLS